MIDIETTGGNSKTDKITEIAIYKHDGTRIVEEYQTLINPERRIPYNITVLTGITDEMVADAPKFYEVAKKVVEMTEDAVFVAHNASFDYNFIRNEYRSLGYEYKREKLCTVRMSRKAFPGRQSYSLGVLCRDLGIKNDARHRAAGDAMATVQLLEMILAQKDGVPSTKKELLDFEGLGLHPNITRERIAELPRDAGVYYFRDENEQLIYVGKSVNIRSRILSHLSNATTSRAQEMRSAIAHIDYELTGSELVALLKESEEIKTLRPFYNRAQRRTAFAVGLFADYNEHGYITFSTRRLKKNDAPLTGFSSQMEAAAFQAHILREFELCQKLVGLYKTDGPCFYHHIDKCHGACVGAEDVEDYNTRAQEAIEGLALEFQNVIIIDRGRDVDERSVVAIEGGKYLGYGFADLSLLDYSVEWLKNCITPRMDNRDVRSILRGYLSRNDVEKIIPF